MEDLKALAMKGYDAINAHDLSMIDHLIDSSFVEHEEIPGGGTDWAAVKAFFGMMWVGMPDMHLDVQRMAVDEDRIWMYGRVRGTNTGEMMGMPATGKNVDIEIVDILRFKEGKLVEHWGVTDNLGMMQQLGVVPMPEAAHA